MEYKIRLSLSVRKNLERMPERVQTSFGLLTEVLRLHGPMGPWKWKNYGKLRGSSNRYHCHLAGNHDYVACWAHEKDTLMIEVYYAGSHQDAPY